MPLFCLTDRLRRLTRLPVVLGIAALTLLAACDSDRVRREAAENAEDQSVMEGSIAKSGKAPKKAARWREVLVVKNKKNVKTKTFKIAGGEWKIRWKTKPAEGQDSEEFLVVLYDKKNKDVNEIIANDLGEVDDFLYLDGKGEYYLDITTALPYEIVVEERRAVKESPREESPSEQSTREPEATTPAPAENTPQEPATSLSAVPAVESAAPEKAEVISPPAPKPAAKATSTKAATTKSATTKSTTAKKSTSKSTTTATSGSKTTSKPKSPAKAETTTSKKKKTTKPATE